VNERWTRQRYVGDLSFCAIVGEDLPRDQQTFVEFVATFDGEGKLMNVVKRQEKRLSEMRLLHAGQQWFEQESHSAKVDEESSAW